MKQATITVSFDAEKLTATKKYMGKKDADLQLEMADQLLKLYEKYVPASIREYIDERDEGAPSPLPKRPKKDSNVTG